MRRNDSTTGIYIIGINRDTPIMGSLTSSGRLKLTNGISSCLFVCHKTCDNYTIITSSVVVDNDVLPAKPNGGEEITGLLDSEESDARLLVHVERDVKQCKRVVVVSKDTHTFALLLQYTPYLQTIGLIEIWQQY